MNAERWQEPNLIRNRSAGRWTRDRSIMTKGNWSMFSLICGINSSGIVFWQNWVSFRCRKVVEIKFLIKKHVAPNK